MANEATYVSGPQVMIDHTPSSAVSAGQVVVQEAHRHQPGPPVVFDHLDGVAGRLPRAQHQHPAAEPGQVDGLLRRKV